MLYNSELLTSDCDKAMAGMDFFRMRTIRSRSIVQELRPERKNRWADSI